MLVSFLVVGVGMRGACASASQSDLDEDGILDNEDAEVVVLTNKTLPAGEYEFKNLTLTNNAVLIANGDPDSSDSFKGVKITFENLTISSGSSLNADGTGFGSNGPGSNTSGNGASYGGVGNYGNGPTYGSASKPVDLGSGYRGYRGGGAIRLIVTDTLTNEGSISANGASDRSGSGSGGSIYVTANKITGGGGFNANGGTYGGGGRIALYYQQSSFAGGVFANGGCDNGSNCGGNGTVVLKEAIDDPVATYVLTSNHSNEKTASETLRTTKGAISETDVNGQLSGSMNFTSFDFTEITSGEFANNGFLKGEFNATIEGVSRIGSLRAVVARNMTERKIKINGYLTGDLAGIVEGYIDESTSNSDVFDRVVLNMRLTSVGGSIAFASVSVHGTLGSQTTESFPSTDIQVIQTATNGTILGQDSVHLSTVVTHVGVVDAESSFNGQGFSFITYTTANGQGQGWTYDTNSSKNVITGKGMFSEPLSGIIMSTIVNTVSPAIMQLGLERLNYGAAPAKDVKVKTWGPGSVSPGQTVDYIVEARNDGLLAANDVTITSEIPWQIRYQSNTGNGTYDKFSGQVSWVVDLPPGGIRSFSVRGIVLWGLPQGMKIRGFAQHYDEKPTTVSDPSTHATADVVSLSEKDAKLKITFANEMMSLPIDVDVVANNPTGAQSAPTFSLVDSDNIIHSSLSFVSNEGIPVIISMKYPNDKLLDSGGNILSIAGLMMKAGDSAVDYGYASIQYAQRNASINNSAYSQATRELLQ